MQKPLKRHFWIKQPLSFPKRIKDSLTAPLFSHMSNPIIKYFNSLRPSLRICLIYIVLASFWIALSDRVLLLLISDNSEVLQLTYMQTAKGIFYVLGSGFFIFLLIEFYLRSINITLKEKEQLNEALELKSKELEKVNRDLRQFAYITSNSLQEPLRMVIAFLGLFQKKYGAQQEEKAIEYISHAQSGAADMKSLINKIFEYYDLDDKKFETEPEVSLNKIIDSVFDKYQHQAAESDAQLSRDNLPLVIGNRELLFRLFDSLIDNSLRFRNKDRKTVISIKNYTAQTTKSESDKNGNVAVLVEDNGIGINESYRELVFELFQKLHNDDSAHGYGIGLAMARKIVAKLDGEIMLLPPSDNKVGARICIQLASQA